MIVGVGFAGFTSLEQLRQFFPIDRIGCQVGPDDDALPLSEILAIVRHGSENFLEKLHWGLTPFWAKDPSIGYKMINARAETVAEKPSFRNAFRKQRCLIVATGFYEWKEERGKKQSVFITQPEGTPFAFAGLWETWRKKDGKHSVYKSCAIITTRSSECLRAIHHRMPAILRPEFYQRWLEPEIQNVSELKNILKNGLITELITHPVAAGER